MTLEQIIIKLQDSLSKKRFVHSTNVMSTSILLAEKYGEDQRFASLAGLLHDCAREIKKNDIFILCEKYNIMVDNISINKVSFYMDLLVPFLYKKYMK